MRQLLPPLPLLALLGACGGPSEDTGLDPSPYIYEEDAQSPPAIDADALGLAIEEAAGQVLSLNAVPVWQSYLAATATADAYCPAVYTGPEATYWFDQCTDSSGTSYAGYGYVIAYDDLPNEDYSMTARGLFSVATVDTASGDRFESGGSASWLVATNSGELPHTYYQSAINGSFTWTGPEADGTWMHSGLVPDLTVTAAWVPDNGFGDSAQLVYLQGALSGMAGAHTALSFEGFRLATATLGSACELEPSGVISLRLEDGTWVDVLFDGPTDEDPAVGPGICDGCGAATWRGEPVGEVCADFSALFAWSEAPW